MMLLLTSALIVTRSAAALPRVVLLLTVRLPAVVMLPDAAAIVTLSVFDVFLTLKSLSTVSVP